MFVELLDQLGDIDSLGKKISILMNDLFCVFDVFRQEEVLMDEALVIFIAFELRKLGQLGGARVLLTNMLDAWMDFCVSNVAGNARQNLIIGFECIRFQVQIKLLLCVEKLAHLASSIIWW